MKFSQLQRSTIADLHTFNPPPGYYDLNSSSSNGCMFPKGERFAKIKEAIQEKDWKQARKLNRLEKQQTNEIKSANNFNINRDKIFKKAFVSQTEDTFNFTKLQMGLLPKLNQKQLKTFEMFDNRIQQCLESIGEEDSPGPGSYQCNIDFVKPKIKYFSIKQDTQKQKIQTQPIDLQLQQQNLDTIQKSNASITTNFHKLEKKNLRQIFNEVGIELQILREKQMKYEHPGPGYYDVVNNSNDSSKCYPFLSKVKRFDSNPSIAPPVGKYQIEGSMNQIQKGKSMPKSKKVLREFSPLNIVPGPGAYNPIQVSSNYTKPCSNLFSSAFNNGSCRFPSQKDIFPGPAEYNPKLMKNRSGVKISKDNSVSQKINTNLTKKNSNLTTEDSQCIQSLILANQKD